MGCYDTVVFRCPDCKTVIETQSKAGKCDLSSFVEQAVPIGIAADLIGERLTCTVCQKDFYIRPLIDIRHIPLQLLEHEE